MFDSNRPSRAAWLAILFCWISALAAIWVWMFKYEFYVLPPAAAYSQTTWPSDTTLQLDRASPTMLLFLHPKCPCTRASVRELEKLLTGAGLPSDRLPRLLVVARCPPSASDTWHNTDILRNALKLPHAQLIRDPGGRETSRFGAVSSGTVMLFDPEGQRRFAGGVTASRGQEGDNVGIERLRTILAIKQTTPRVLSMPAFGCKLCSPEEESDSETCVRGGACSMPSRIDSRRSLQ